MVFARVGAKYDQVTLIFFIFNLYLFIHGYIVMPGFEFHMTIQAHALLLLSIPL